MNLEEYSQYRETLLHAQPGFAYNTYLCTIPQDFYCDFVVLLLSSDK